MLQGRRIDLIIDTLLSQRLTVTTLARDDKKYGRLLQTAFVRGEDELFYWGVGPQLKRGDIVAMYVPDSKSLRPEERQRVRHLYSVAADTQRAWKAFGWNQVVFLYRRVSLVSPLYINELRKLKPLGQARASFRNAGKTLHPLGPEAARAFWRLFWRKNAELADRLETRLVCRQPTEVARDDVAISYASEDLGFSQKLYDVCLSKGLRTFYGTSAGVLDRGGQRRLIALLREVFAQATLRVALLSRYYLSKRWPLLELAAMLDDPDRVVAISVDGTRLTMINRKLLEAQLSNKVAHALSVQLNKCARAINHIDIRSMRTTHLVDRLAKQVSMLR